jgi:hypothetical protein
LIFAYGNNEAVNNCMAKNIQTRHEKKCEKSNAVLSVVNLLKKQKTTGKHDPIKEKSKDAFHQDTDDCCLRQMLPNFGSLMP